MNGKKPIVFIVDGDPAAREPLRHLLKETGYRVVELDSMEDYLQQPQPQGPACLLLDAQAPGLNGSQLPQALAKNQRALPIILLAEKSDTPATLQAIKALNGEVLAKPWNDRDLLSAVARALERCRQESETAGELAEIRARLSTLTPSESKVLTRVVSGKLNKQIASEFGVTEQTIKMHRSSLMNKLEAGSLAALVRMIQSVERTAQLGDNLSRCILDAIPSPIFAVEADVRIVDFNLAASKMLDQDRLVVISKRAGEILHCVHSTEVADGCGRSPNCCDCVVRNSVNAALQGMRTVRSTAKVDLLIEGQPTEATFLITATPLFYEGRDLVLMMFENLTELVPGNLLNPDTQAEEKPFRAW